MKQEIQDLIKTEQRRSDFGFIIGTIWIIGILLYFALARIWFKLDAILNELRKK